MQPTSLPLSLICDVITSVVPAAVAGPTYSTGLIIGPSRIVGTSGVPARLASYLSVSAMLLAGYDSSSPEVQAATLYFGQAVPPQLLYVGLQDGTAIQTLVPAPATEGTGYVIGDVVTVQQTGAQGGQATVTSIGANGAVTGLQASSTSRGTGYSLASSLPVSGGTGTGLEVNITAIGETPLQAVEACRIASPGWYGVHVCNVAAADHLAILAYTAAASPDSFYFGNTADADAINASPTSVNAQAQAGSYSNGLLVTSTTQNGAYPSNAYFGAALMGYALGAFTGLAGSYFGLANTTLVGVYPEPLTSNQVAAIEAQNGNVYVSFASGQYVFLEQGLCPSGQPFDFVIFSKAFASDLQYALVGVIKGGKQRQTNTSQTSLLLAASQVAAKYVDIGWIAPGVYNGAAILSLASGQSLPKGYLVQSDTYANQSATDRDAGKAMTVYVTATLAGIVDSLTVGVAVQR